MTSDSIPALPTWAEQLNRPAEERQAVHVPLIGIGGIDSPETALAKIEAGASLLQLYTGLIYEGPGLISEIKKGLTSAVRYAGAKNIG